MRPSISLLGRAALLIALPFLGTGCATTSLGSFGSSSNSEVDGAFLRAAQTWDLNHDGNVTCDEWRTYALSLFKEADANHDGKLTPEEFTRFAQDKFREIQDAWEKIKTARGIK